MRKPRQEIYQHTLYTPIVFVVLQKFVLVEELHGCRMSQGFPNVYELPLLPN
jgi:hypothetical protein